MRFRINSPEVVSESFGGEVVAIHFGTGNYYSLTGTAEEILGLLDAGFSIGEVVGNLRSRYEGLPPVIADEVGEFVGALLQEELIVPRDGHEEVAIPAGDTDLDPVPSDGRKRFQPPRLEKYGDMQDLLLLDPIHDVDEMGWPSALPDDRSTD